MSMNVQIEKQNMIKQQLRTGNVLNESILDLFDAIPRHEFVPSPFQPFAYSDTQIELGFGQRMMTPLEEALLLQSLELNGSETVLEIGTGSGFLTALLSRSCKKVISIDYFQELTKKAQEHLNHIDYQNVDLQTGDASQGVVDNAPYDVIIYTSAIDALTETQRLQLIPGGKLFAIIGKAPVMQGQLHQLNHQDEWSMKSIFETCLPPIIVPTKPNAFIF